MTTPATRAEWLTFLGLGFMWGSSYLFIKLAVDSFGTFTLISLRLLIGAAFLWAVLRISRTPLPRDRRPYGHLLVMSIINIAIPFALITWAEQSVDSALAAILNSTVPLFVLVIAPAFLPDEPIRVERPGRAGGGVHRRRPDRFAGPRGDRRHDPRHARPARRVGLVRVGQRLRPAERPRPARR